MNNYSYDALHRITAMHNSLIRPGLAADNAYSTSYSYDRAGNIQHLTRRGFVGMSGATPVYDLIDDLHYSYAPGANPALNAFSSKLQGVDDGAGAAAQPRGVFLQSSGYGYDGNGNMIGAGSVSAEYNILNLPTKLATPGGERKFEYVFGGGLPLRQAGKYSAQLITGNQAIDEMRHYLGGMEFKDGILEAYNFGDGRVVFHDSIPTLRFQYRLHDHLGNTVVFFEDKNADGCIKTEGEATSQTDLEIIQRLLYYPFGMALEGLGAWNAQPWQQYRYNGKEQDVLTGWYEYGFRWYIDGIGRFSGVDPIADRFAHLSVYNYASNDPVKNIDLHGLQGVPSIDGGAPTPTVAGILYEAFQNARAGLYNTEMRFMEAFGYGDKNSSKRMRVNYDRYGGIPLMDPVITGREPKKGPWKEAGDAFLDILAITPITELTSARSAVSIPFLAARTPSSIIPAIARKFGNFQCMECADAMIKALSKEGLSGQMIDITTPKSTGMQGNIWSDTQGELISTNGRHRGVLIEGKVYDNIHTNGIEYDKWLQDFHSPSGFSVKKTDF